MPCERPGCGGPRFQPRRADIPQKTSIQLQEGDTLYLEFIAPIPETKSYKGPITGYEYRFGQNAHRLRRRLVGINLEGGEVHPADAEQFVKLRWKNFDLFKYVVKSEPAVIPEPQLLSLQNVKEISIKTMQQKLGENPPARYVNEWLRQEKESELPRKGMIRILEEYGRN